MTSAATHGDARLAAVPTKNAASDVRADTAHRSRADEKPLAVLGLCWKIHVRRRPGRDPTPSQRGTDRARSKVRSAMESVFAHQKYVRAPVVRTVGLARATTKFALANLVLDARRYLRIVAHPKTA